MQNAFTRKGGSILDAEKHHTHGSREYQSFHLHSLLSLHIDIGLQQRPSYSRLIKKLRVVSRLTFVNVRCR
jgi:hypothetical protein